MRRALVTLVLVLATAALAPAVAVATAGAAGAADITCALTPSTVDYGQLVTAQGTIDPATDAQPVTVAVDGVDVADGVTDASGSYSLSFTPPKGGAVTARLSDGTASAPVTLTVNPLLTVDVGQVIFFTSVTLDLKVAPATYADTITVKLTRGSLPVGEVHVAAAGENTQALMPIWGVGDFRAQVSLPAWGGLAARSATTSFTVSGHRIAVGSHDEQVRALLKALKGLHFRVPAGSSTMTRAAADSVMAFHKAYRLPRTYVFKADDWRRLTVAKPLRPRHRGPALHIEVDKTRQIMMVVKSGVPFAILHVSTGATGNTPEGTFRISSKAHVSATPYAPGIIYWVMDFYPRFAIHAFASVPPYAASHGCVREPNWVAPWVYNRSYVGETVYIFH